MTPGGFRFCSDCGSELPEPDPDGGVSCACGRRWYRNPAPTAGCVIVKDGMALITQRANDPEKGRFDIPGGFLEEGETPVAGVKRELREELGVEVDVTDADYIQASPHRYGDDGTWTLALGFRARLTSGDPSPADDVESFRWVEDDDLEDIDFAWDHDRELVRRVLNDE